MADLVIAEKQKLVEIANAIREKAGTSGAMAFDTMASAIGEIKGEEEHWVSALFGSGAGSGRKYVFKRATFMPAEDIYEVDVCGILGVPAGKTVDTFLKGVIILKQSGSVNSAIDMAIDFNNISTTGSRYRALGYYRNSGSNYYVCDGKSYISYNEITGICTTNTYHFAAGKIYHVIGFFPEKKI